MHERLNQRIVAGSLVIVSAIGAGACSSSTEQPPSPTHSISPEACDGLPPYDVNPDPTSRSVDDLHAPRLTIKPEFAACNQVSLYDESSHPIPDSAIGNTPFYACDTNSKGYQFLVRVLRQENPGSSQDPVGLVGLSPAAAEQFVAEHDVPPCPETAFDSPQATHSEETSIL